MTTGHQFPPPLKPWSFHRSEAKTAGLGLSQSRKGEPSAVRKPGTTWQASWWPVTCLYFFWATIGVWIEHKHVDLSNKNVTSSTAQGGGGSFKNSKPIGEVGCCESRMAERIHWLTERWLELCFLEWLQWLQWSPHHNCWMCGVVQL